MSGEEERWVFPSTLTCRALRFLCGKAGKASHVWALGRGWSWTRFTGLSGQHLLLTGWEGKGRKGKEIGGLAGRGRLMLWPVSPPPFRSATVAPTLGAAAEAGVTLNPMEDPQPERGCHRKPRVSLQACLAARQAGDRLRTPWGFQREASSHRSLVQRLVRQKSLKGHRVPACCPPGALMPIPCAGYNPSPFLGHFALPHHHCCRHQDSFLLFRPPSFSFTPHLPLARPLVVPCPSARSRLFSHRPDALPCHLPLAPHFPPLLAPPIFPRIYLRGGSNQQRPFLQMPLASSSSAGRP